METNTEAITKAISKAKAHKPEVVASAPIVRQEAELPAMMQPNWGIEDIETTDLLVPKIFHQQAMSKFVADGVARPGDFCDNLTGEILCKKEDTLEIIVFGAFKTLITSKWDVIKNRFEYLETTTVTPENAREIASLPFVDEKTDGTKYKYSLYYNFYCLIPSKIEQLPFVLSMGSTKTQAAKTINNMRYNLVQVLKLPPVAKVFNLKSVQVENDQGKWFGVEVKEGRNSTQQEMLRAHAWYVKSQSQKFTVVEEEQQQASNTYESNEAGI